LADTREAVENVKSLARTFQCVIDLAAALEGMASVEAAANAANARLVQARKALEKAEESRRVIEEEVIRVAKTTAEQIEATQRNCDELAAQASARAAGILDGAKAEAVRLEAQAKQSVEEAARKVHTFDATIAQRQRELADLDAKINRARAAMAEMLKG